MGKITIEFNDEEYSDLKDDVKLALKAKEAMYKLSVISHEIYRYRRSINKYDVVPESFLDDDAKSIEGVLSTIDEFINKDNFLDEFE